VKNLLKQVPVLVWAVRRSRSFFSSLLVDSRSLFTSLEVFVRQLTFNEPVMRFAESYLRRYYAFHTSRLWEGVDARPEWFDHRADLYRWAELRVPFWVERGVFSREVMFEGCRVLDLCCGDGFYPYHFYSGTASQIDAVDRDRTAITHARKWHAHPRIRYALLDLIADEFPGTEYDVITWDGAIEHFSAEEIRQVLRKCVKVLKTPHGVLNGYTIIARGSGRSHPDHQHEFATAEELKALLRGFFPFVGTLETKYTERHNLYFRGAFRPDRLRRFE
jgi:2-polyprenyl-3-methyl-5-hydroxy-6-metoxy-1,4-benzoquinol methylase